MTMMKRQLRDDLILSICYILIINNEFKCDLTNQDELILRFMVTLYRHLALSHPKPSPLFVKNVFKPSPSSTAVTLSQTRKYVYLLMKIIMLEANSV
jgi:hypothetical protein